MIRRNVLCCLYIMLTWLLIRLWLISIQVILITWQALLRWYGIIYLSILMWIIQHYTCYSFKNFTILNQNICFKKCLKVKNSYIKSPVRFELMIYRLVDNDSTCCAMLLGNNFWKEKYLLDFIVYFDTRNYVIINMVVYVPYHPIFY